MKIITFLSLPLLVAALAACSPQERQNDVPEEPTTGAGLPAANPSDSAETLNGVQEADGTPSWVYNYDQALEIAKGADDTVILVNFTGTQWCPPCKMIKRDVFDTAQFQQYAARNLVLLELDFHPDGRPVVAEYVEQNRNLAMKHQIQAFPTLLVLNAEGEELARQVGNLRGNPTSFINWISQLQ